MATSKQKTAARKNVKKAATAKRKKTLTHLPKAARSAPGKQASKVKQQKKAAGRTRASGRRAK
jgi:hypothetical protein